jgi:hypothetical protein
MKKLFLLLALVCPFVFAESGVPAPMGVRVLSSVNLHVSYSGPGAQILTGLKSPSHVLVYNASAAAVAIGTRSNSCGQTTGDSYPVPANSGLVIDQTAIAKVVCVRSLSGSSVTTGTIYASAW